jgi:hypothetical protein
MGSNPGTVYWMDVRDACYYIHMKITKIKVAKWGKPKKNIFKTFNSLNFLKITLKALNSKDTRLVQLARLLGSGIMGSIG